MTDEDAFTLLSLSVFCIYLSLIPCCLTCC